MIDTLDGQLCLGDKNEMISADPLRACVLAHSFGLMRAAEIIARVVDLKVNLRDLPGFPMLKQLPMDSNLFMRLVGMQAMRAEALANILFTFDDWPMNGYSTDNRYPPRCSKCSQGSSKAVPTWMHRWSNSVYELALHNDLKDLPYDLKIETPSSIFRLVDYPEGRKAFPETCLSCVSYVHAVGDRYSEWASGVASTIKLRLFIIQYRASLFPI